jgi:hypothetical protein
MFIFGNNNNYIRVGKNSLVFILPAQYSNSTFPTGTSSISSIIDSPDCTGINVDIGKCDSCLKANSTNPTVCSCFCPG